jgi:tRNA pseudouridine55 synthase
MNGILLVNKPSGMTSHDVVDKVRKAAGTRRVGHTGTLDPSATGLLILCLGTATRLSEFLTALDKVYEGEMELGTVTDSHDLDGEILETHPVPALTLAQLQHVVDGFVGDIMQVPPMVSAVKVNGERLYKRARKGEVVERPPRPITVHEFVILSYDPPRATFRVRCTRGTYARTLCHDAGQQIGCGAALAALCRTAVGHHRVEDAATLDGLKTPDDVRKRLRPLSGALDMPSVVLSDAGQRIVAHGGAVIENDLTQRCPVDHGWIQLLAESGELLALGQVEKAAPGLRIQPKRVLTAAS